MPGWSVSVVRIVIRERIEGGRPSDARAVEKLDGLGVTKVIIGRRP